MTKNVVSGTYGLTSYVSDGAYHSIPLTPPSAPAGLTVGTVTTTTVALSWSAATANTYSVAGYNVYVNGTLKGSTNTLAYTVTGLSQGTSYTLTVSAFDSAVPANSGATASASATTAGIPGSISSVTVTTVSSSALTLNWTASSGATSYTITRNGSTIATGVSALTYADTSLSASTSYSYTVAGVNSFGTGATTGGSGTTSATAGAGTFTPALGVVPSQTTGIANGTSITVTTSSPIFGTRAFGSAPWLYDTVDQNWLGGTNLNTYAGYANGDSISNTGSNLIANPGTSGGGDGSNSIYNQVGRCGNGTINNAPNAFGVFTSRGTRNPFNTKIYSYPAQPGEYVENAFMRAPRWPAGYPTRNNRKLYVSWYQRLSNGYSQTNGATKILRLDDFALNLLGKVFIAQEGLAYSRGASATDTVLFSSVLSGQASAWQRVEVYIDGDAGGANIGSLYFWFGGKNQLGAYSAINGGLTTEICGPGQQQGWQATSVTTNNYLNTPVALSGVSPAVFGYNANGLGSETAQNTGMSVDITEFYVDTQIGRFEISDSNTWDVSPTATNTRELQGVWSSSSATVATFTVNQGAFASLAGKYLWWVTGIGQATQLGSFS